MDSEMRASDADRDRVAERLREALADGRLTPDEHSERLDVTYGSKTLGELEPLTRDLPDRNGAPMEPIGLPGPSPRPVYGRDRVGGEPGGRVAIAVMGGATRSGDWVVPASFTAFAMMGGVTLDLREARFEQRETTINASVLMGGIDIIVPDDIEVRVDGFGFMGGYDSHGSPNSVTEPGTPIVRVKGLAIMGGVTVKRKPRKHQRNAHGRGLHHGRGRHGEQEIEPS